MSAMNTTTTMPVSTTKTAPPQTVPARPAVGTLRLTHPTRAYSVSRNPFGIAAILPLIVLSFIGLSVAIQLNAPTVPMLGGFLMITLGLLLIPSVTLSGSLTLTHDGVIFERGNQYLTAGWKEVTGLVNKFDCGLCLTVRNPSQSHTKISLPGGFSAANGEATIPLRMFGDRKFSIIYDIRDRIDENLWLPALKKAGTRSTLQCLIVYGLVTAFCAAAILATYLVYS